MRNVGLSKAIHMFLENTKMDAAASTQPTKQQKKRALFIYLYINTHNSLINC